MNDKDVTEILDELFKRTLNMDTLVRDWVQMLADRDKYDDFIEIKVEKGREGVTFIPYDWNLFDI